MLSQGDRATLLGFLSVNLQTALDTDPADGDEPEKTRSVEESPELFVFDQTKRRALGQGDEVRMRIKSESSSLRGVSGVYLMAGAGLMLGTLLIVIAVQGNKTWTEFTHAMLLESGVAFLIAAILALTIDGYMRTQAEREHAGRQSEIEENIFRHLFGFGIEPAVVDELTETIFNSKLMRERLRLQYEFSTHVDPEFLRIRHTVSYIVVNNSRSVVPLKICHYFENVISADPEVDGFVSLDIRGAGCNVHLGKADLIHLTHRAGIRRIMSHPSIEITPRQRLRVRYSYETIRRQADCEVWITTLPASGLRMIVVLLDKLATTLAFAPDASHRNEPEIASGKNTEGGRVLEWRTGSGLLPYQGIVLYWTPRENVRVPPDAEYADAGPLIVPQP